MNLGFDHTDYTMNITIADQTTKPSMREVSGFVMADATWQRKRYGFLLLFSTGNDGHRGIFFLFLFISFTIFVFVLLLLFTTVTILKGVVRLSIRVRVRACTVVAFPFAEMVLTLLLHQLESAALTHVVRGQVAKLTVQLY